MALLCSCQSISKSYSTRQLFKDLSLEIFAKERVGLIGPNGSGKTTLLKILSGLETPDSGTISYQRGIKIGFVPQTCTHPNKKPDQVLLEVLEQDQSLSFAEKRRLTETWLSRLGFTGKEGSADLLSGGWKKRLSFAKALILSPDLLLLDEPTNHLDVEGIFFLEKFLAKEQLTYLLVSHDRYFLQNTTKRIVEVNRIYPKGIFAIHGSFTHFLQKKEEFLQGQSKQEESLLSKARREEEWLKQSPKARTTKAQSRIRGAQALFQELSAIKERNQQKRAFIDFAASDRQTKKLIAAKNLSKRIDDKVLFRHLDFTLSPSSRIGLMGPNGSGKTTLLRLLAKELEPDEGTLKRADDLKIVTFDQHRLHLPDQITLREALAPEGEFVFFRGRPIHVAGWCKRFLFSPDLLDMPIGKLSGGEKARIHIAHLMLQNADLLLLDEPTNDLDIPTLESLEESLLDFPGALVLITHDRYMLNRLCNSLLVLGGGETPTFFADFAQWESAQKERTVEKKPKMLTCAENRVLTKRKEISQIEKKISHLEKEVYDLHRLLSDPSIVAHREKLQETCAVISCKEKQIEELYLQWEKAEKGK